MSKFFLITIFFLASCSSNNIRNDIPLSNIQSLYGEEPKLKIDDTKIKIIFSLQCLIEIDKEIAQESSESSHLTCPCDFCFKILRKN